MLTAEFGTIEGMHEHAARNAELSIERIKELVKTKGYLIVPRMMGFSAAKMCGGRDAEYAIDHIMCNFPKRNGFGCKQYINNIVVKRGKKSE